MILHDFSVALVCVIVFVLSCFGFVLWLGDVELPSKYRSPGVEFEILKLTFMCPEVGLEILNLNLFGRPEVGLENLTNSSGVHRLNCKFLV